jgi:hypothetical protein
MSIIVSMNRFKYNLYIHAFSIIKKFNKPIKSSDDIKDINYVANNYRIGDKLLLKIDEIIKTGPLKEYDLSFIQRDTIYNISQQNHINQIFCRKSM